MAVTFVGSGAIGATTGTSQALAQPTCTVGDLLIAFCFNRLNTPNTISPPAGAGWTEIIQANDPNSCQYAAFWKNATATTGNHTFTKATNDGVVFGGVIAVWTGHNSSSPIDATTPAASHNASADAVTFSAFDPTATNAHIIFAAYYLNDLTTFAAAMSADTNPDCTTRFDEETGTGSDFTVAVTSGDTTDGSNIASRTWASNSTADAQNVGVVFGVVPAAVAVTVKKLAALGVG